MGYFSNGFVFTSEPDFTGVGGAFADLCICGRKHKRQPLWLVDLWRQRSKRHRHGAFCSPATDGFRASAQTVDVATAAFLKAFDRLTASLGNAALANDPAAIRMALQVALAAGCPTYYFAADCEATDLGCNAAPESLISFGCRSGVLSLQYQNGQATVTSLRFLEDEDDGGTEEVIAIVGHLEGFALAETRDIDGGQLLYENPVRHWPKEAGDPRSILGLGTWEPLANVDGDFAVVYEHLDAG